MQELIRLTFRQLKDISLQARTMVESGNYENIGSISQYNHELKTHLKNHFPEELLQTHVDEIPVIDSEYIHSTSFWISLVGFITLGIGSSWILQHQQERYFETQLRTMIGKYSSIEFLIKSIY